MHFKPFFCTHKFKSSKRSSDLDLLPHHRKISTDQDAGRNYIEEKVVETPDPYGTVLTYILNMF